MSNCVIETPRFTTEQLIEMISTFANTELCSCALEAFKCEMANKLSSRIETVKNALYVAVINEMVLRATADYIKEHK